MNKKLAIAAVFALALPSLTGCATWERAKKDFHSEMSDGLPREIVVYNIEGKKIFEDKGTFDIRRDEQSLQYVDNTNKKHNIYFGDNTTVIVKELEENR